MNDQPSNSQTTKADAIERIEAALRDCRWGYLRPAIVDLREAISILEAAIGDQPMPNDTTPIACPVCGGTWTHTWNCSLNQKVCR